MAVGIALRKHIAMWVVMEINWPSYFPMLKWLLIELMCLAVDMLFDLVREHRPRLLTLCMPWERDLPHVVFMKTGW